MLKRLFSKKVGVGLISFALVFSTVGPISANASTNQAKNNDQNLDENLGLVDSDKNSQRLEELADSYVITENTRFKITDVSELKDNATKEEVEDLQEQVEKVNKILSESSKSGEVVQNNDGTIRVYSDKNSEGDQYSTFAYGNHKGQTYIDFHLTTVEVWLSKKAVGSIIVVSSAAAATIITSYFPALPVLLANNIGVALIAYFTDTLAKPAYMEISYLGNIQTARYG